MMAEYDKLSVQVDKIQAELDKARMLMLKDIVMFDTMYDKNVEYFKELQLYIKAGEEKSSNCRRRPFRNCACRRLIRKSDGCPARQRF